MYIKKEGTGETKTKQPLRMKRLLNIFRHNNLTSHIREWICLPVLNKDNTGARNNCSYNSFRVER